jgi:chromosome segregation protein
MEEIIFSGSDSRKPLNFAEVSLTFAGAGTRLNLDYDEITITRRLFRSGEVNTRSTNLPAASKILPSCFSIPGWAKISIR